MPSSRIIDNKANSYLLETWLGDGVALGLVADRGVLCSSNSGEESNDVGLGEHVDSCCD